MKKKASAYYELIIKTLVFITLIATAVSFFGVFTVYINLNYAAKRVVREVEITGQVTGATYDLFREYKERTNIGSGALRQTDTLTRRQRKYSCALTSP